MIATLATWIEPVALLVGWASASATVLIVGIWLVRKLLGTRLGPGWHSVLGWLVVARLICLVAPESRWSWRNWVDSPAAIGRLGAGQAPKAEGTETNLETLVASTEWMAPTLMEAAEVLEVGEVVSSEDAAAATPPASEIASRTLAERVTGWAALVWASGAVGMLGIAVASHWLFSRRVRRFSGPLPAGGEANRWLDESLQLLPVRRRVLLRALDGLASPVVFGYFRPVILLPAEVAARLTAVEARHIFLHELAHIRCGDVLANWVLIAVRSLHWFNPLVWASLRRIVADREVLRDAMALRALPGGDAARREYGHTLLRLATTLSRPRLSPGLASLIHTEKEIQRRIAMIKTPNANTHGLWPHLLAGTFALALAAFTFTAAARGQAANEAGANTLKEATPAENPSTTDLAAGGDDLNANLPADAKRAADTPAAEPPRAQDAAGDGRGDRPPNPDALHINEKRLADLDAEIARMTAEGKKQEVDILTSLRGDLLKEIYRAKYLPAAAKTAKASNDYRALSATRAAEKESAYARANDPNFRTERMGRYDESRSAYEQPGEIRALRHQLEAIARQFETLQRQLSTNKDIRKLSSALSSADPEHAARYNSYLEDLTKLEHLEKIGLGPRHPDIVARKAAIESQKANIENLKRLDETTQLLRALEKKLKTAPVDDRPAELEPETASPPRSADDAPAAKPAPELPPGGTGASDDSSRFDRAKEAAARRQLERAGRRISESELRGRDSWPKSTRTKPAPEVHLPVEGNAGGAEPKRDMGSEKAKPATESAPHPEPKPEPNPAPEESPKSAGTGIDGSRDRLLLNRLAASTAEPQ